ncbi:MAG: hypothetical protein ACI9U2_002132 [Bradymonadia bacterium]|jgi:hypothetical protein
MRAFDLRPALIVSFSLFTAFACDAGSEEASAVEDPTASFTAGIQGRTFEGSGSFEGLSIIVPPGALSAETTLVVTQREGEPLPSGGRAVGPQFEIGPDDLLLDKPLAIILPFDPSQVIDAGVDVRGVKVWAVLGEGWTLVDSAEVISPGRVQVAIEPPTLLGAGIEVPQ